MFFWNVATFIKIHCVILLLFRSSHRRCSLKIGVLKNFAKFIGKHLCQSLFFNKVAGFLFKKRLWRTPFLQVTASDFLQYDQVFSIPCFYSCFQKFCNIYRKTHKRLQHRCFPVNIAKFLRPAFFMEHLWWLLLHLQKSYNLVWEELYIHYIWQRFRIITLFTFWDILTRDLKDVCLQTNRNNRIC